MILPPRAWLKPDGTLAGVGTWSDTNNGSAEMVGAVEYVPAARLAEVEALLKMAEAHTLLNSTIAASNLNRAEAAEKKLAEVETQLITVCQREAEMIARYDAKLDALEVRAALQEPKP